MFAGLLTPVPLPFLESKNQIYRGYTQNVWRCAQLVLDHYVHCGGKFNTRQLSAYREYVNSEGITALFSKPQWSGLPAAHAVPAGEGAGTGSNSTNGSNTSESAGSGSEEGSTSGSGGEESDAGESSEEEEKE